jgi:delta 1-pyrroline-5-carboxylate dehydrogenase
MRSPEDLYMAVDALIRLLRQDGAVGLATVLDHRLHKVAWTTSSELIEELQAVLANAEGYGEPLTDESKSQVAQVLASATSLVDNR